MVADSEEIGYISCKRIEWHTGAGDEGSQGWPHAFWTHGDKGIGALTTESRNGDPLKWAWAKPDRNAALKLKVDPLNGGLEIIDKETGAKLTRSGDWVKMGIWEGSCLDDTVLDYQAIEEGAGTVYLKFRSGGDWLRVKQGGELNVKGQGEYASFFHPNLYTIISGAGR